AVLLAFGLLGFPLTRVGQMAPRYKWINERAGLFRWRRRDDTAAADTPKSGGHFFGLRVESRRELARDTEARRPRFHLEVKKMKQWLTLGLALGLGLAFAESASAQIKLGVAGPIT